MKTDNALPMPVVSAWDPRAAASGSIDPLGALRPFTAIATALLPGVTTITSRVRYLSWVCAGLSLLDELPKAPSGGRAGRARRQEILAWERLLALATGMYAKSQGTAENDSSWHQLRGVSYVRRAIDEGIRSPKFPMLRNQGGVGGVGTYWVTLVAGGLIESDSGMLTPRGADLGDAFLRHSATPSRETLLRIVGGEDFTFRDTVLIRWGRSSHLGAAPKRERQMLANALLEPDAHRRMAMATRATSATVSDGNSFQLLARYLSKQDEPLAKQLASVLTVALSFECLHRDLLYRFNQVLAAGSRGPVRLRGFEFAERVASLAQRADALQRALATHQDRLPRPVATAVHGFSLAVEQTVRARNDKELALNLIQHHGRVQAGKLDASRQPKRPWAESSGNQVAIAPRYALEDRPPKPDSNQLTHPYRIEQFTGMLREAGVWESTS